MVVSERRVRRRSLTPRRYVASFKMLSRGSLFLTALAIGLVVGVSYPFVDLGLAYRAPNSEACVWGKAYLPLTLGVSVVLLGSIVTALAYTALMWQRRRQSKDDAV